MTPRWVREHRKNRKRNKTINCGGLSIKGFLQVSRTMSEAARRRLGGI
jgi:hypothetical protein